VDAQVQLNRLRVLTAGLLGGAVAGGGLLATGDSWPMALVSGVVVALGFTLSPLAFARRPVTKRPPG